jgi:hypothetical protein
MQLPQCHICTLYFSGDGATVSTYENTSIPERNKAENKNIPLV